MKILKLPIDYILSNYLVPLINLVIRRLIVPDLLHNGLVSIPLKDDKLVIDIRLPAMPDYTTEEVDLGFNAGFFTAFVGREINYPTEAMHFSDREGILFQLLLNEYTVASLIDTVINLNVAHFEMKGNALEKVGLELTTKGIAGFFLAPLRRYGERPMNIEFSLLKGTTMTFN